ncbi:MAG: LysR family transcriptional regulator substrate-binding protein, partial [Alphaproteobacteria bacterium]
LRVTASNLGIIYLYGELLESFIAKHPRIEVVLTAAETPFDGVRQVLARGADAAFVAFPVDEPGLSEVVLGETEHVVIVTRTHPLARRRGVTIADLQRYPFIRYKVGAGSRVISDALFLKRGGYPEIFLESNDTEFVKRIVGLGYASAITPRFVVTREARDRRLKSLKVVDGMQRQKYGLVFRRDARMRALNVFAAFCLAHKEMVPS